MYLKNAWYVAAWSSELNQELLARIIMDEPVVLYRKADGQAVALEDRCCHRSYPLSRGTLVDDAIQCGYHGFVFDCQGTCIHIPNQSQIPAAARVRHYPLVEKHHLLWVWPGDPEQCDPASIPDVGVLDDPRQAWRGERMHVQANYRLVTDNLSDLSHLTFVHGSTIGNAATALADVEVEQTPQYVRQTRWMMDTPPPPTYRRLGGFTGNIDRWQIVTFKPPSFVELRTGGSPAGTGARDGDTSQGIHMCNVNFITPETATTSHYFWAQTHDFRVDEPEVTEALFGEIQVAFNQDLEVFKLQQEAILRNPGAPEVSCKADRAQMATRRLVDALLKEQSEAQAEAR